MTDRELFNMALAMLEDINQCSLPPTGIPLPAEIDEVMEALRARLAQPEPCERCGEVNPAEIHTCTPKQPEPVAWMHNFIAENVIAHRPADLDRHHDRWTALYKDPTPCQTCEALARTVMMDQTSHDIPPQRKWLGLTDEEIEGAIDEGFAFGLDDGNVSNKTVIRYVRVIEAKLREKNG